MSTSGQRLDCMNLGNSSPQSAPHTATATATASLDPHVARLQGQNGLAYCVRNVRMGGPPPHLTMLQL
eukprot:m.247704 g.247704  ORF g.247704 m.247704 type:complete len:68 (+) comp26461_c0_seq1:3322-3525(+)